MMTRWIAALAAVSLAAAPAAAEANRTAAPIKESDSIGGGIGAVWVLAAAMVLGFILVVLDDDDDDLPESP
jgi:hypothetical protein